MYLFTQFLTGIQHSRRVASSIKPPTPHLRTQLCMCNSMGDGQQPASQRGAIECLPLSKYLRVLSTFHRLLDRQKFDKSPWKFTKPRAQISSKFVNFQITWEFDECPSQQFCMYKWYSFPTRSLTYKLHIRVFLRSLHSTIL